LKIQCGDLLILLDIRVNKHTMEYVGFMMTFHSLDFLQILHCVKGRKEIGEMWS
jgi:hypothetical protein